MRRGGAGRWRLLVLLLAGPWTLAAQGVTDGFIVRIVGRVTVVAKAPELDLALALADEADAAMTWPGLGRQQNPEFRLIVVPDAREYARVSRGRAPVWGGAVTLPAIRTILLRTDAGDPLRLLRHELAHLALHAAVRGRVPRWFDEGFATWGAGEFDRLDAMELNIAVVAGQPLTFAAVDRELASPVGNPTRAYALAATAVLYAARAHPEGSLAPLLGLLRDGVPFDSALQRTTGRSLDRFEEAWARDVRRRYGVLAWGLGLAPWLLAIAFAIAGIILRRRRDAPRRAALEIGWELPPADEAEPAPPAGDAPVSAVGPAPTDGPAEADGALTPPHTGDAAPPVADPPPDPRHGTSGGA